MGYGKREKGLRKLWSYKGKKKGSEGGKVLRVCRIIVETGISDANQ